MKVSEVKWLILAGLVFFAGCASGGAARRVPHSRWQLNATPLDRSAAELDNNTQEHLAWAKTYRARVLEVEGPRTIENTLVPYDEMMMHLDAARSECELFARVHPDSRVREVAEEGAAAVVGYMSRLAFDRELYEAFRELDTSRADSATQHAVPKILRSFRRAGADKPEEVRARIADLSAEIAGLGREFVKNIREDEREIVLESPADLAGLPRDWIASRPRTKDGKIHVTTRYSDYLPFMAYARSPQARLRLYREFKNRGYRANLPVLSDLLARRYELAQILGYADWADYVAADAMIGTAAKAQSFIDEVSKLSNEPARLEYAVLIERKRRDVPDATTIEDWEKDYYEQLAANERYTLDPRSLRVYFNFPDVLEGLFQITQRMFGITYRQVHGLNLWNENITAWDIYDGKERIGRFYVDPYRCDDENVRAAHFSYRTGIAGVRLPQSVLVCSLPYPPGGAQRAVLMEHDEVVALFHEFGHLLHNIFAGHGRWMVHAGMSTERDFVDVPARLMEEMCYNLEALQLFAKHYETGEVIPPEAVEKLRGARDLGKGLHTAHQMFYAAVSLGCHSRDPNNLDTTRVVVDMQQKYSPFPYVDDTHFQCSFEHLDQYSAYYYTYMWSFVIAKDLFTRFDKHGIFDNRTGQLFRETVLEPGESKKAAELVQDFLGRPYSLDAFKIWLNRSQPPFE